jgi:hypothetical protein
MNGPRNVVVKKGNWPATQTVSDTVRSTKVDVEDERAPEGPAIARRADVL